MGFVFLDPEPTCEAGFTLPGSQLRMHGNDSPTVTRAQGCPLRASGLSALPLLERLHAWVLPTSPHTTAKKPAWAHLIREHSMFSV